MRLQQQRPDEYEAIERKGIALRKLAADQMNTPYRDRA
jgi:hypothetical protein